VRTINLGDWLILLAFVMLLGAYWGLPKETIYQSVITLLAAGVGVTGWQVKKKRKRK